MFEIENEELDEEYIAIFFEVCECCGKGGTTTSCPGCGEMICQDCLPPFGAHICEPGECYQLMM